MGGTKSNPVSHWGKGAPRFRTKGFWKDAVRWNRQQQRVLENAKQPLKTGYVANPDYRYERPRIFPSLCDWLDDEVPIEWLADFLKLIHDTPNLSWLLLTKRPENFESRLRLAVECLNDAQNLEALAVAEWIELWLAGAAPANVWIGTSVEDQKRADERIPELLRIPAKVRFLSVEPLLGPVRLNAIPYRTQNHSDGEWTLMMDPLRGERATSPYSGTECEKIDWVIVGGESGPSARPCNVEWIRDIVRQCKAAAVPCFVKQLGAKSFESLDNPDPPPTAEEERNFKQAGYCRTQLTDNRVLWQKFLHLKHPKGGDLNEFQMDIRVREFPEVKS